MQRRLARRVLLVACTSAVLGLGTGCPRVVEVDLVNRTGGAIVTDMGGRPCSIPPGGQERISGPGARPRFTVATSASDRARYYKLAYPRHELGDFRVRRAFHDVVALQVEPDGAIYAVDPRAEKPVMRVPPQPDGFPLRPQPAPPAGSLVD